MNQLDDLVARARTVAKTWDQLKAIAAKQQPKPAPEATLNMTVALDELSHAVEQWVLATNPTERVEPLEHGATVRITGGPWLGRTGVVVNSYSLIKSEVEVLDTDTGDTIGTYAIQRDWLDPVV